MRIALINPPTRGELEKHWATFPILGLVYVAASLRASGHDIVLLDGKLAGLSVDAIVHAVARARPDLVGITCMTVDTRWPRRSPPRCARSACVPIAMGGAHVNAVRAGVLEACPAVTSSASARVSTSLSSSRRRWNRAGTCQPSAASPVASTGASS